MSAVSFSFYLDLLPRSLTWLYVRLKLWIVFFFLFFVVIIWPPARQCLSGHVQPAVSGAGRNQPPALTVEKEAAMLEKLTAGSPTKA